MANSEGRLFQQEDEKEDVATLIHPHSDNRNISNNPTNLSRRVLMLVVVPEVLSSASVADTLISPLSVPQQIARFSF